MRDLLREFGVTVRRLVRAPSFTIATVGTLALGIGAATSIFTVVDGILLRPLPYPDSERIMQIRHVGESGSSQIALSFPNYVDLRDETRTFAAMAAFYAATATARAGQGAARVGYAAVTPAFFDVLRVPAMIGRTPGPQEGGGGETSGAVVSEGYWRDRLGGERDLSALTVRLDDVTHPVVGVMPASFEFPSGTDIWIPSEANLANQTRTGHNFQVIGRLADGVTPEAALADLSAVARALAERYGEDTWMADATAISVRDQMVGGVRTPLLILMGAAGLLLLIAFANVVNLLLARTTARGGELSVRLALGAGRGRVAGYFLSEALVLALAGGALGVLAALWGVPALLALNESGLPRVDEISLNTTILVFALAVSIGAGLVLGLVPALRFRGGTGGGPLGNAGRTRSGARAAGKVRQVLAGSQVAVSLVLLVGAGLLARSFLQVTAVDPGFRTDDAFVMDLWLPSGTGPAAIEEARQFHTELLRRARELPGVVQAADVSVVPLGGFGGSGTFIVLEGPEEVAGLESFTSVEELRADPEAWEQFVTLLQDEERAGYAQFRVASEGYFATMGIPLIRGRVFEEGVGPDASHVAVISQSLAEARWPGEDPIGEWVEFGNMDGDLRPIRIVGVVGDVREGSLETEPAATLYVDSAQRPGSAQQYSLIVRADVDRGVLADTLRGMVSTLGPDVAVRFRTLGQIFSNSLAPRRFALVLLGVFCAAALLLAMLGIYGVIAYLVEQRRREIGIRMAVGATARSIRTMVVRQGALVAVGGVGIGLLVSWGFSSALGSMLYQVAPMDLLTYGAAGLVLVLATLGASWLPAVRAAAVEPTRALRTE